MAGLLHEFAPAASIGEIAPGRCVARSVGALDLLICNAGGHYYAIENRCSHLGKPLAGGRLMGTEITCPFHAASFDIRDGRHKCFPASRPIRTFATRVSGATIEVATTPCPPPAAAVPPSGASAP